MQYDFWRDGRVVEGAVLERLFIGDGNKGSNPFGDASSLASNQKKYVYVNLSTFMRLRTVYYEGILMPDMDSCVYLDKEDGYAGYIIIDIKDGRVVKYKFEEARVVLRFFTIVRVFLS